MSCRRLLVVVVHRTYLNSTGAWTTETYNRQIWEECLASWDQVTVAGPCIYGEQPQFATKVDGPNIQVAPLQNSFGYWGYLKAYPKRFWELRELVRAHDALVAHVPSDIGAMATYWAKKYNKPYGIDVRGDQSVNHKYLARRRVPFALAFATIYRMLFAWVRSNASVAIYVSQELETRFPLGKMHPTFVFSDARIPPQWFLPPRDYLERQPPWVICSVGRLEAQKGFEYLLEACAIVHREKPNLMKLRIVGGGPLEAQLKKQAQQLGLTDRVEFLGFTQWGEELIKILVASDLFVLSSITEGMPRAAIEAMACGLPVIATRVGGVPEILSEQDLTPARDTEALAEMILDRLQNPTKLRDMATRNSVRIKAFHPDTLIAGKRAFYQALRKQLD